MKILLINPRGTGHEKLAQNSYPPLGLLYLARELINDMHDVNVLDANAFNRYK